MFDPYFILNNADEPSTPKSTSSLVSKLQVLSINRSSNISDSAHISVVESIVDIASMKVAPEKTQMVSGDKSAKKKRKKNKKKKDPRNKEQQNAPQQDNGAKSNAKRPLATPSKPSTASVTSKPTPRPSKAPKQPDATTSTAPKKTKPRAPKKTIAGNSTSFCHWRRSNLLHIRLTHRQLDRDSLEKYLVEVLKVINSKKQKPKGVKAIIELQENNLNDDAIKLLCTFIFQQNLRVSILKLWKNRFGDDAALAIAKLIHVMPMQEVHLSHNRIGTVGAKAIFNAIHANKQYPVIISKNRKDGEEHGTHEEGFLGVTHEEDNDEHSELDISTADHYDLSYFDNDTTQRQPYTDRSTILDNYDVEIMPLWLRLEYNRIDAKEALEHLKHLGLSWCNAENRNLCGPFTCAKKKIPHVHLYCFEHQYQNPELAPILLDTQSIVNQMRENLEKRILEERANTQDTCTPAEQLQQQVKEEYDLAISREISTQLPLYIFVDTCSVLNMMSSGTGSVPSHKLHIAQRFCFKNLLRKAKLKHFGDLGTRADSIHLILTDTTMQELDFHKNQDQRGGFSQMIRQLTRDGGTFFKASRLNFLTLLGAHEAELLIKSEGKEFFGQDGRALVSNDLKLLQVALFWQEAIGVSGSVMVLTDDYEVHRRAKQHGLPAELLRTLDANLTGFEEDPWTPQLLRQVIPQAFQNNRGENLLDKAPMKTSFRSIYDEMASAIELVQRWMEISGKMSETGGLEVDGSTASIGDSRHSTSSPEPQQINSSSLTEGTEESGEDAPPPLTPLQQLLKDSESSLQNWKQLMNMRPALLK